MQQGYSGSFVHQDGDTVIKDNPWGPGGVTHERICELISASNILTCLPEIYHATPKSLRMQCIQGKEGLTAESAMALGSALRGLHDFPSFNQPVLNGILWLLEKANHALLKADLPILDDEIGRMFPDDALVHGEPVQIILTTDGSVRFIDFDGMGRGSKFHDLGFIRYYCDLYAEPELWSSFITAYGEPTPEEKPIQIPAGLVALAYATFHDFQRRVDNGIQKLGL